MTGGNAAPKPAQVADVLTEIQALMAAVRANVGQLNAILTAAPEVPSDDPAPA